MFQLNYLLYTLGTCIITILYILLFKDAIYLISILQQACICFHGNGKKEVNLIHVLQSIKNLEAPIKYWQYANMPSSPPLLGKLV